MRFLRERDAQDDSAEAAKRAAAARPKRKTWEDLYPPGLQDTELTRLPDPDAAKRAMNCAGTANILVLHGGTHSGKSRTAMLCAKEAYDAGRDIEYMGPGRFAELLTRQYDPSWHYGAILHRLLSAEVLVLDDVMNGHLTESAQNLLYALITHRGDFRRQLIITTRQTGEALGKLFGGSRGDALVRRLREGE